jgi:DNA-binding NtrC family response regulator
MPDHPSQGEQPVPPIVGEIADLARRLREAEHLEPELRERAADLLGGLASELDQAERSAHKEHLATTTAQLVRAVKDQHEPGLVEAARERVEQAVAAAEAKAPVTTDLVLRLIDVLAGLGI